MSSHRAPEPAPQPLYARVLRLRHLSLGSWQRAALAEGTLAVGVLLALADLASAWTVVVLPVAVAAVVKAHDVLQGELHRGEVGAHDDRPSRADRRSKGPADDDGAGPSRGPAPSGRTAGERC